MSNEPIPAIICEQQSLKELAFVINAEYMAGMEHSRRGIEHFRQCGQALLLAKEQCEHGEWLPWLKANVVFSKSQAYNYMSLAKVPVTGTLEDAWRVIQGNAKDDELHDNDNDTDTGSEDPVFLPHVEQEVIARWLFLRRERWGDELKPTFFNFMRQLIDHLERMEEDINEDS